VMARTLVALLSIALAACGGGGSSSSVITPPTTDSTCSTSGQVSFVRTTLRDIYYWYKDLPDPNPAGFSSPEAYLEAVRYRPLDSSYSYITSRASSDAFYSESQFIGVGLSYRQTGSTELRITQVFPGGSAAAAGLARGDYLLAIGGKPVAELLQTGEIATIFGPEQVGVTVAIVWRTLAGERREATLTKALVTIPTVSATAVFPAGSARVGYIFFRNFVRPSIDALNTAFAELAAQGVTDLVLDLRYNGGGLVDVAQHLVSLIGGEFTQGQIFIQLTHNDKNTARNSTTRFLTVAGALGLPRLVVIQTGASASASETVVNGLRPFMPVTTVGDRSYGKPVGQYGFNFCDKVLFPVSFLVANALGEADYFNGIPADCSAADDLDRAIANPNEASLAEALYVMNNGRCSARAAAEAEIHADRRAALTEGLPRDGWRQMLNAW